MYDYIMFDLDGTLTDPKEGITKSVQYALSKMGITETDLDKLTCFIGPPLVVGFSEYYGMNEKNSLEAVAHYRKRYSDVGLFENAIIPGIPELLQKLKNDGKHLFVATSKPHVFANKILERYGILKFFEKVSGAELDGTRNDKKDVIAEVLADIPKDAKIVMVGDRRHDCIGAKYWNIPCIGVRFGYAEEGELEEAGAIKIVAMPEELYEVL